jgi:cell division protease FtsH
MNGFLKQISLWLVLLIIVLLFVTKFGTGVSPKEELQTKDFRAQLDLDNIKSVVVLDTSEKLYAYKVTFKDREKAGGHAGMEFHDSEFTSELKAELDLKGVQWELKEPDTMWTQLLFNILPLVLIFGVFWFFMFRHMQGGSNKAMSFGKSRARLVNHSDKVVTFNDVAGVDEAKEELQEIIEFLKDPKKFSRLGGKIPKGVLLIGPPGSGKTLLARAVAGEAHVPFFSISGSDFVEMFVGVGASRVRDLFQQGQKHAPCIIFIDEIDAVGRQRGAGLGGGHDEREQTLNQLLVEMDGFNTTEGVILMAATNRPDVLDKALLRPGRFDRQVVVANPDIKGREAILQIHIRNNGLPLAKDVEAETLARGTAGFSGADLANMVNEAALLAARREQDNVTMQDFEDAKDRVLMGPERRSLALSTKEKRNTAVHEAGHVLVGRLVAEADPVHKVTIIPRGPSLGLTSMLPKEDRHSLSKSYCLAQIRVLMGGRAAEEVVFSEYSSGAANDLKRGTELAHAMVCEWGMSEIGPISFGSNQEIFLGRDFMKERDFSDETASAVDKAIHRLLEEGYADAKEIIVRNQPILMALADELIERETLEAEEIDGVIRDNGGADLLPSADEKPSEPLMPAEEEIQDVVTVEPPPDPDEEPGLGDVSPDIVPGTA